MRATVMILAALPLLAVAACDGDDGDPSPAPVPTPTPTATATPPAPTGAVARTDVLRLDNGWAMTFLPDGRLLVTERTGRLRLVTTGGAATTVSGAPAVVAAGQGGLLDVALDPQFVANRTVWLSFAEAGGGGAGLAVARGTLSADATALSDVRVVWRQAPKISGDDRHFGGRIAFAPDRTLYVTAGERHQGAPAQDVTNTLGKIVRINRDGSIPADNPLVGTTGARTEIWSWGHRNPYGLVFAADGRLFESEHGPSGGDEFNLITRGANYGWRTVSEGDDGEVLPRHASRPEFAAPLVTWTPAIAPGGMIQYRGERFVGWNGDFVLAGLQSQGLIRVRVTGGTAAEIGRIALGTRIRDVEQGMDGSIWVIEDGPGGRLVRLDPA